jgi:hypothetical protein
MLGCPVAQRSLGPVIDEAFLGLMLSDELLLRTEFDAIIAAEWPSPPDGPFGSRARAERTPARRAVRPVVAVPTLHPARPYTLPWTTCQR